MWGKIMIPIFCHLIGDYVLQSNYVDIGKKASWYLLLVHCILYILPFYIVFGLDFRITMVFVTHFLVDMLGRWKQVELDEFSDQLTHLSVLIPLYMF